MAASDNGGNKPRKPLPLAALIPMDAALIAASLLSFAYFHHVNPLFKDKAPLLQATIPQRDDIYAVSSTTAQTGTDKTTSADTTAATVKTESGKTDKTDQTEVTTKSGSSKSSAATTKTTANNTVSSEDAQQGTESEAQQGGDTPQSETKKTTASTTPTTTRKTTTTTTTTALQYDLSGWGAKWPELFSIDNTIEKTDHSYRSHDIYIDLSTCEYADSNCYIADIYVRKLENFKTAFEHDEFVNGPQENMYDMAARTNAILAINGDFTGGHENGVVIRDYVLYRDQPRNDVGVLFYDGTYEIYGRNECDTAALLASGACDSMTFGPALVKNGNTITGQTSSMLGEKHPRSGFGYYEPGHYCFVAADGRGMGGSAGVTCDEFAALFGDVLGCYQAYNLDGGKTSQLWFDGACFNQPDGFNGNPHSLRGLTDIFYIGEVE
ncbi:MAG TPA: hypothetical protein DDX71_04885 [Ruminococcus sp.]|nr:hypothetical protein [Ruminococcus sp.]